MCKLEALSAGMAELKAPLVGQCESEEQKDPPLRVKIPSALLVKPTQGILRPRSKDANRLHTAEY